MAPVFDQTNPLPSRKIGPLTYVFHGVEPASLDPFVREDEVWSYPDSVDIVETDGVTVHLWNMEAWYGKRIFRGAFVCDECKCFIDDRPPPVKTHMREHGTVVLAGNSQMRETKIRERIVTRGEDGRWEILS